jgi:hypothetical protein
MSGVRGIVLYEGPSAIDGQPIVVVATLKTKNPKTGNMVQTWILRSDVSPTVAINEGADRSICGDCPHRGAITDGVNRMRTCYVNVRNAPLAVWNAYRRGVYPTYNRSKHAHLLQGRKLRLGSYGDPCAVPLAVWVPFLRLASKRTGYTHQWRDRRFARFARYVMASVETVADATQAQAKGWRTFRIRTDAADPIEQGEIICPASPEGGARMDCSRCAACHGTNGAPGRASVAIIAHGGKSVMSAYRRMSLTLVS